MPRANDTEHDKRLQYFNELRTTSHWAYPMTSKGFNPNIDNKLSKPRLDDLLDKIKKIL